MHIALFSPGWPLAHFHNGIVTFVDAVRPELEKLGHKVSVFSGDVRGPCGENIHDLRPGKISGVSKKIVNKVLFRTQTVFDYADAIANRILKVHARDPIDIIEMEESFGWCARIKRLTGIPVLVKLHGPAFLSLVDGQLESTEGALRIRLEGQALREVGMIASPSLRTMEQTLTKYGVVPRVKERIVNPIRACGDSRKWSIDQSDSDSILFVGRIDRRKGADIVLDAFAELSKKKPDLRLTMVGPDNGIVGHDGTLMNFKAYCRYALPSLLSANVDYRGGMVNDDITELRLKARVTVVASRWENQGYSLLEAMNLGCPIVCSDTGGSPESIFDEVTGLLARSEDAIDFGHKIGYLLDNPSLASRIGARAHRHIVEKHSAFEVARSSVELYRRVVHESKVGSVVR